MRRIHLVLTTAALTLVGCAQQPPAATVDTQAIADSLRALDRSWSDAAGRHDAQAFASFYASDARLMPPNSEAAVGSDAIVAAATQLLSDTTATVSFAPAEIHVSTSGDMAWEYGTWAMKNAAGENLDNGDFVVVWKPTATGDWKVAADIFNSNNPAPSGG